MNCSVVNFIEKLTLTDDYSGEPFKLLPFQIDVLNKIFDPNKPIHRAFLFYPRGQGKTQLCAGITLAALMLFPSGQQILSCAADKKQAAIIFDKAAQMIRADAYLLSQLRINKTLKSITHKTKESFYQALSSEDSNKFGLNPSICLFDELSEFKSRVVYDKIISAQGKRTRTNPLSIVITTANEVDKESLVWEQFTYAKSIVDNPEKDPHFLASLLYADESEDWHDRALWRRVMPALGSYTSESFIEREYKEACLLPTAEYRFRMLYLNTWLENASSFIRRSDFEKCRAEICTDGDCVLGVDLSSTLDLSSITALWSDMSVKSWSFCPKGGVKARERLNKTKIDGWIREGWITETDGDVIDYDVIEAKILELSKVYNVKAILLDRYNATGLATRLVDSGEPWDVEFPSLTSLFLNAPCKELQRLVINKLLKWDGNPVLSWATGNVRITFDRNENMFPTKSKSIDKIDPCFALLLALAKQMTYSPSIYEVMSKGLQVGKAEASSAPFCSSR